MRPIMNKHLILPTVTWKLYMAEYMMVNSRSDAKNRAINLKSVTIKWKSQLI